jgi:alpha-L-rhamnosidase
VYGYLSENGWAVQSLSAAALSLGQLPPGRPALVKSRLQRDMQLHGHHFTVGEVGVSPLLRALSLDAEMHADALQLMLQRGFPSYGWWLDRNATTCWESWSGVADLAHPGQPTHNHVMLCGGADDWLYSVLAGLSRPVLVIFETGAQKLFLGPKKVKISIIGLL